jgi:NADH dehydrogenase/NADH:ubiquinone oxidoreductase subunit G
VIDLSSLLKDAVVIGTKGAANSHGAFLYEINSPSTLKKAKAAFVALGEEKPSQALTQDIEKVPFIVTIASYVSPLTAHSNVVLPAPIWAETFGHFVNIDGRIQSTKPALRSPDGIVPVEVLIENTAKALGVDLKYNWRTSLNSNLAISELVE